MHARSTRPCGAARGGDGQSPSPAVGLAFVPWRPAGVGPPCAARAPPGVVRLPSASSVKPHAASLLGALQVAKQLKEQQMVMRGHRETSMVHELNR